MWNDKINPRIAAEEQSFLHLALKIGQLGCVCSFILIIISNTLNFLFVGGIYSHILYEYYSQVVNLFSIITSILLAIGYYALLRSNMSRLALPYVFLSLIAYEISWTFLLSLGIEYYTIFSVLDSATTILFTLILTWIKWTINQTVSDRGLLRNIVLVTILNLFYSYFIIYLLVYLLPFNGIVNYILLMLPRMLLTMIVIILVARLFGQDQVVVVDDEMDQITFSEWL